MNKGRKSVNDFLPFNNIRQNPGGAWHCSVFDKIRGVTGTS